MVRGWIDIPVEQAQENVAAWFDGIGGPDRERPYRSVSAIARSCGPYVPSDTNGGTAPEGARTSFFDVRSPDRAGSGPAPSLPCAVLRPKFTISSMTTLGWSGPSEPVKQPDSRLSG